MTARSPWLRFASSIIFEMKLVCSMHPGTPGAPPFCTEVSIYLLLSRKVVSLLANIPKNILPSTFRREMVRNCFMHDEFSSLGIKHSSAMSHSPGRRFTLHTAFNSFHSLLLSRSHCLYTLYGIPLGPGAEPALALLRKSLTSFHEDS